MVEASHSGESEGKQRDEPEWRLLSLGARRMQNKKSTALTGASVPRKKSNFSSAGDGNIAYSQKSAWKKVTREAPKMKRLPVCFGREAKSNAKVKRSLK